MTDSFTSDRAARQVRLLLLAIIIIGAGLRLISVAQPVDSSALNLWREADYAQIARAFSREGMNPLYPRVDWRGTTSGHAEMELPLVPWTGALLYKAFGYNTVWLRIICAALSIAALVVFARIATVSLPPAGSLAAVALFAFNLLLIQLGAAIQPEAALLLVTLMFIASLMRWQRDPSRNALFTTALLLGAALLIKATAVYLGIVLAYFLLRRQGLGAFRRADNYIAAVISVAPVLAWYLWAHSLYQQTGLSLGVSNETHLMNIEVLRDLRAFLWGNYAAEMQFVYGSTLAVGVVLVAFFRGWREIELPVVWLASVYLLYLVLGDTSGDTWAFYYHMHSVPPVALLFGHGLVAIADKFSGMLTGRLSLLALTALVCLTLIFHLGRLVRDLGNPPSAYDTVYACAAELSAVIPDNAHILTRGGRRTDPHGHPVAYNASMVFLWLDRKGSNYAVEDFDSAMLNRRAADGVYWVTMPQDAGPVLDSALNRYRVAAICTLDPAVKVIHLEEQQ